jgi:hypothetical protein
MALLVIAIVRSLAAWFSLNHIFRHRLTVAISNEGPHELRSVVVYVTGRSYSLGDLTVGESRAVYVEPISESNVELEFVDFLGKTKRLNAGGYFEPGYQGTFTVRIESDDIHQVEDGVGLLSY